LEQRLDREWRLSHAIDCTKALEWPVKKWRGGQIQLPIAMKNIIQISTRRSSDGRRIFIDRMLISMEDLIFGNEGAVFVSGLMIGAIDDFLSNIEKQKNNIDFTKNI
jgi:hypothetical protein